MQHKIHTPGAHASHGWRAVSPATTNESKEDTVETDVEDEPGEEGGIKNFGPLRKVEVCHHRALDTSLEGIPQGTSFRQLDTFPPASDATLQYITANNRFVSELIQLELRVRGRINTTGFLQKGAIECVGLGRTMENTIS